MSGDDPDRPSDESLMRRFQEGEVEAFDELVRRHRRPLYAFLHRSLHRAADADDVFQDVFMKVVRAARAWQESARFTTWFYTIARNALIDAARRRKVRKGETAIVDDDASGGVREDHLAADQPSSVETLIEREQLDAVEALVATLPDEQREVFLLKREGLTFDDIAIVIQASKNTAKSRLRYALEKLRAGLVERGLFDAGGPA